MLREKIKQIFLEKQREVLNNKKWDNEDFDGMLQAKLKGTSYYALNNLQDFGAECIAEYLSGNPREIAKTVCKLLLREGKK